MTTVSDSPVIPIPCGVMVPKSIRNLLCPDRSINCERVVLGPMRVQAPIMARGEAAGVATILALRDGKSFAEVDTDTLRSELSAAGAIVKAASCCLVAL